MESFGTLCSIPASFAAGAVYSILIGKFIRPHRRLSLYLVSVSAFVLIGIAVEVILLATVGVRRSRGLIGPAFYQIHSFCFFFGPPSLVNVIMLGPTRRFHWLVPALWCAAFGLFLVLLQYGVFETLYGVESGTGPYSEIDGRRP
ncbi:MAG: hypothetical protein HZB26_06180 [Candidatus Hydrogenedentes bacterium]|nr:hypothetical protein [Candidatus Hydrogenedentota bacterium]